MTELYELPDSGGCAPGWWIADGQTWIRTETMLESVVQVDGGCCALAGQSFILMGYPDV